MKKNSSAAPSGDHEFDAFSSAALDISAIGRALPPDCEAQVWAFSDRGTFCTLLTRSAFQNSRAANILNALGIAVSETANLSEVPAWSSEA